MIQFVNAKINIGLSVVGRRPDGYHLLETCFYPVGLHNGTPQNPEPFCDVIELSEGLLAPEDGMTHYDTDSIRFIFSGNRIDCPPEKNLVVKAAAMMEDYQKSASGASIREKTGPLTLSMLKLIPDGAGLGGGSADATFTLRMLNERLGNPLDDEAMQLMAVRLGADCPVFVKNRPTFAEGIGEIFSDPESESVSSLSERGYWLALLKPDLHISTREAFAGLTPRRPEIPLREALRRPVSEWRGVVKNDFEESLFPLYPELARIKEALYNEGAIYASMTGSGAALYGIFASRASASRAAERIDAPYRTLIRL